MNQLGKVIAAFSGVFLAGAVFGGAIVFRWAQPAVQPAAPAPVVAVATPAGEVPPAPVVAAAPAPRPPLPVPSAQVQPAVMRQFTQRLKLSSDQREKIMPVVTRAAEDLARLRRENLQETSRITETMYADVAASLNPTQLAELEKMKRKMQERVAEERKKRGEGAAIEPGRKGERGGAAGRVGAQ
jgi:hypothetical protein